MSKRQTFQFIFTVCLFIQSNQKSLEHQCNETPLNGLLQSLGYSPSCVSSALSLCSSESQDHSPLYTKLEEIHRDLQENTKAIRETVQQSNQHAPLPSNCADLLKQGVNNSGVFNIYPYRCCQNIPVSVFCDQTTDGGGWTLMQRRVNVDKREDFARSWAEYALGFGDLRGEFWLGLDNIHALTNKILMEMRIDLEDYEDEKRFAKYERFHVGNADTKYILSVGRYSGTAGDGFLDRHDGHPFSTYDMDNDSYEKNCAELYPGGWWYDKCHISNINGKPLVGAHKSYADGINWHPWREYHYSMKKTSMMVRPAFTQHQETTIA